MLFKRHRATLRFRRRSKFRRANLVPRFSRRAIVDLTLDRACAQSYIPIQIENRLEAGAGVSMIFLRANLQQHLDSRMREIS
jgi:hypothetical protein